MNSNCKFASILTIDPCIENTAILEPSDADYLFSAKVCHNMPLVTLSTNKKLF